MSSHPGEDDALPLVIDGGLTSGVDGRRDAMRDDRGVAEDAHAHVISDDVREPDPLALPARPC